MKKLLSVLFSVILVSSTFIFSLASEEAKTIKDYNAGDIIEFGWYPQSKVDEESDLFVELNMCGGGWHSYEYYYGTGEHIDGNMKKSDEIMLYKDVVFAGKKYRGVRIKNYRPQLTSDILGIENTYQKRNGYGLTYQVKNGERISTGYDYGRPKETTTLKPYYTMDNPETPAIEKAVTTEEIINTPADYWFEYEPVKWQVVDPDSGLVVSQTVLDSQSYNGYLTTNNGNGDANGQIAYFGDPEFSFFANDYENSEIRNWLKEDFMNYVFSGEQLNTINDTTIENSAYIPEESKPSPDTDSTVYDSASTTDKIYLLSYNDITNPDYKFGDLTAGCTDYAKCQGVKFLSGSTYSDKVSWRLRTAGNDSRNTWYVNESGSAVDVHGDTIDTSFGIRPAMNFKPDAEIKQAEVTDNEKIDFTGYEIIYDANGGEGAPSKDVKAKGIAKKISKVQPTRKEFEFVNWNTQPDGKGDYYGESKDYIIDDNVTLYAVWSVEHNHLYEKEEIEHSCTEHGYSKYTCACGDEFTITHEDEFGHNYKEIVVKPTCTEQGYTIHKCEVCGDSYDDNFVEPTGHNVESYVSNNDAKCSENGTKTGKCSVCNEMVTIVDEGSAKGHSYKDEYVRPTCEEEGYIIHRCECGREYKDNYVEPLGHNFVYRYNGDATVEADGTETEVCTRCKITGETRIKVGSKINPTGNTVINTCPDARITYRSKVKIRATAKNLPADFHLVMQVNGTEYIGDNKVVEYDCGQLRKDYDYTVWVADADGNIRTNNNGEKLVQKGGHITCIDGILERIVAFFKGLFCSLPEIVVGPKD